MMRSYRVLPLVFLGLALAGCPSAVRPPPVAQPTPSKPTPAPEVKGATLYTVDPTASDVKIMVYRGGTLSRLGHNHVMTSKTLTGQVSLHPDIAKSSFELSFPVADLIVDDTQARQAAGADFPGEIPQSDRDGTRKNMLRAEVLDGEHFARVQLRSVQVSGSLQSATMVTRITIKDVSHDVTVLVSIATTPAQITATGQFEIKQTDFGIKPFSIALGAVQVLDQLKIQFRIVAEKK
jgi:polyisoprenoid-binding protein YceI